MNTTTRRPWPMLGVALALAAVSALGAVGCGKKDETASSETSPTATTSAPAANTSAPAETSAGAPMPPGPAAATASGPTANVPNTAASTPKESVAVLKVKNALMTAKPTIDSKGITVVADESGGVVLKGSVPTAQQKAEAEKAAKSAAGSATVKNELKVGK